MLDAYVLIAHGTVDDAKDIPEFLRNIRRGHPAPAELVAEVSRRFVSIGGSPLNRINGQIAGALSARLGKPVLLSNRLWRPYPAEIFDALYQQGARSIGVIALAQHSAHVYNEAARQAAEAFAGLSLSCAENWGQSPLLINAFASKIASVAPKSRSFSVVMTAHSLPVSVLQAGDRYDDEVRRSAAGIASQLGLAQYRVAFQSQGLSTGAGGRPIEWLGPNVVQVLDELKCAGNEGVVVAPIGFLADHTEILYDIDVEMRAMADARGMWLARTPSLNDSPQLVDALESVARNLEASR